MCHSVAVDVQHAMVVDERTFQPTGCTAVRREDTDKDGGREQNGKRCVQPDARYADFRVPTG